ncbi:hypothetical protein ABMA32_21855 [Mesorhizobium sp. VNQ89]|uniref:hypothetical protein n=1 Tax=Mesorhizobium quangtriensis TaxID=3157709 RepID=UPI0032B80487
MSEQIQSLFAYFGPFRTPQWSHAVSVRPESKVDIVIVAKEGASIVDRVGVDDRHVTVEYCDCEPMMLQFEAQRVLRERFGDYDIYGVMEDDISIRDPLFLDKIQWFCESFGETTLLQAHRYEISRRGVIRKVLLDPVKKPEPLFAKPRSPTQLNGNWRGFDIDFEMPGNPHSGCCFLTARQLEFWMSHPSFYDRKVNWVGPLESGATSSLARTFAVYRPVEAQADFLEVEHFGVRLANMHMPADELLQQSVIYAIAERCLNSSGGDPLDAGVLPDMDAAVTMLRREVKSLKSLTEARSGLLKELVRQVTSKPFRRGPGG